MNYEAIKAEAEETRDLHDPAQQARKDDDAWAGRCMLCHYTRHPCDAYSMADEVLNLLAVMKNGAKL